jgi:hypothetical protein
VVEGPRILDSQWSCHASFFSRKHVFVNNKDLTPIFFELEEELKQALGDFEKVDSEDWA